MSTFSIAEGIVNLTSLTEEQFNDEGIVQKHLYDMVQKINGLEDDDWEKLPDEVQSWFNDAARILGEDPENTIPVPEDLEAAPSEKPEPSGRKKRTTKKAAAKKATAKKEEKPKEEKPKEEKPKAKKEPTEPKAKKPNSISTAKLIRQMMCEDLNRSLNDIAKLLQEQGIEAKESSIRNVWMTAKKTLEVAYEMGGVKKGDMYYLALVEDE